MTTYEYDNQISVSDNESGLGREITLRKIRVHPFRDTVTVLWEHCNDDGLYLDGGWVEYKFKIAPDGWWHVAVFPDELPSSVEEIAYDFLIRAIEEDRRPARPSRLPKIAK